MRNTKIVAGLLCIVLGTFAIVVHVQAIENHHHHGPYPTISPTKTPTPTPTIDPCQIEYVLQKGDEVIENPCITPTPEATPSPEVKVDAGSDGRHSEAPPMPKTGDVVCTGEKPAEAYGLYGEKIDGGFRLFWTVGPTDHDKQTLFYGKTNETAREFGYPRELGAHESYVDINDTDWAHLFFIVKTWKGNCTTDSLVGDP